MANTSIKLAGGVSFKDAQELGREMRCDSGILLNARKRQDTTEFACFVKNLTPQPLTITVPLGFLERLPKMDEDEHEALRERNREWYCAAWEESVAEIPTPPKDPQVKPPPKAAVPEEAASAQTRHEATPETEATPFVSVPPAILATHPPTQPTPPGMHEIPERPTATKTTPLPKKPRPLHPERALLGRGGPEHKYLQGLVKQAGETHGYRAVIEKEILNGQAKVDVSLERDDEAIACEISVTSTPEQELVNVRKCLAAGYQKVILVASSPKRLKTLKDKISAEIESAQLDKIRFFLPEELVAYLNEQGAMKGSAEKTIRGYKVKVTHSPIDQAEQTSRKQAIAKVIAESVKRMRGSRK